MENNKENRQGGSGDSRRETDLIEVLATAIADQLADSPTQSENLLRLEDVAERLQLSRRTIEEYIAKGELKPIRFGRLRRFSKAQIDAFIASRSKARVRR